MPAINVARTDTFEVQRQKINQIGAQIFSISQGGSDLSTGLLKLGDGTQTDPSLSFTTDSTLGIYKPDTSTLGFVVNGKKVYDYSLSGVNFYNDVVLEKKSLFDEGILISANGQNYDLGTYEDVPLTGGTGSGATATIEVAEYTGAITNVGSDYFDGSYSNIPLLGGSGTGALASFDVSGITGTVLNSGLNYVPGSYINVPLQGGTGSGALADISIVGTSSFTGSISSGGSGYTNGTYQTVPLLNIPIQTFSVTLVGGVYAIDGVSQQTISLEKGNTYRFDLSDSSLSTEFFNLRNTSNQALPALFFSITRFGSDGESGAFLQVVVKDEAPVQSVRYVSQINGLIGGTVNIISGTPGQGGSGATATLVVSGGVVTSVINESYGSGYEANDTLEIYSGNVGGTGSGFEYTVDSLEYTGQVDQITIVDPGNNYSQFDELSIDDSDVGGGGGSGFLYVITEENPNTFSNFQITDKGSGYQLGNVLGLASTTANFTTTFGFETSFVISSASSVNVGDRVIVVSGPGQLPSGTTVTNADTVTNTITVSDAPSITGNATVRFIPPYGGNGNFAYSINSFGSVESVSITNGGNGYEVGDVLSADSVNLSSSIEYIVTSEDFSLVTFSGSYPSSTFSVGDILNNKGGLVNAVSIAQSSTLPPTVVNKPSVTVTAGSSVLTMTSTSGIVASMFVSQNNIGGGTIDDAVTVVSVDSSTQITISKVGLISGTADLDFTSNESATYTPVASTSPFSDGSGATFTVVRASDGSVISVTPVNGGFNYLQNDGLTISGTLVGGSSPADDIELTVSSISGEIVDMEVFAVNSTNGNLDSILITRNTTLNNISGNAIPSNILVKQGTEYTISSTDHTQMRFLIDTGSGPQLTPDLTLYLNDTYAFNTEDSSMSGHVLKFSRFPDGPNSPSNLSRTTNLLVQSTTITVSDTTGILEGMSVTTVSGDGSVAIGTIVSEVVDSTTLVLSRLPIVSGTTSLNFSGVPYEDGVTIDGPSTLLKITDSTPSTLYYYCQNHEDMGGSDGQEGVITISSNNPRVFGSGFTLAVSDIESVDSVSMDIDTGKVTADSIEGQTANFASGIVSGNWEASGLRCSTISTNVITSTTGVTVSSATINLAGTTSIGSTISLAPSTGNITTSGVLKTTNTLNVNDKIKIIDNVIETTSGNDLLLKPFFGRLAKVDSVGAFVIPSGNNDQRPGSTLRQNGAIRFNTDTQQYEGYSESTSSWSSLGGVRDIDGNTYITAEQSVGSNDNRLWFYNDGLNTVRFTKQYLEFMGAKRIRSLNTSAPAYVDWQAQTPVTSGTYLKYLSGVYEVVAAGTTASVGNEPTDTSGNNFLNGTATLRYNTTAISSLVFEEISDIRIDPVVKSSTLTVNAELRFSKNTISSLTDDLVIQPFTEKKVVVNTTSSLVIPVGDNNQKGSPSTGSIRYNTSNLAFEGYDGVNWGSLGGVKDVDQNTYIIPETAPGQNENILYFYNDNNNTLRLTTTQLEFDTVDTIVSSDTDTLNINVSTVTLDNLATTIDNTDVNTTFISSSKTNFDFGLSSGLTNDHLLRLTNAGSVIFNLGYGTGTDNNLTVLNSTLTNFELAKLRVRTTSLSLVRGTSNTGNFTVYTPSIEASAKLFLTAHNLTTGDKETVEYSVIDKGSDVIFTDYNNIKTGAELISAVFDIDPSNNVRMTVTANSALATGNQISITLVRHITKR
jgi:hypothetical protein